MPNDKVPIADGPSSFKAAPESLTLSELNRRNEKYWRQDGGQTFVQEGYQENQKVPNKGQ